MLERPSRRVEACAIGEIAMHSLHEPASMNLIKQNISNVTIKENVKERVIQRRELLLNMQWVMIIT